MTTKSDLIERAKTALASDDELYVHIGADSENGKLIIRKTVWNKAYRKSDRWVLYQETVAVLDLREALNLNQDIVSALASGGIE